MSQTMTITVARIDPPKAANRSGNIVGSDGSVVAAFPDKLSCFVPGHTYDVTFSTKDWGGKTFRNLESFSEVVTRQAPAHRQTAAVVPMTSPQPPKDHYRPTSPQDSERMFVCSLANAFIKAGKIEPDGKQLVEAVNTLRKVYQSTFGVDERTFPASEAGRRVG